MRFTAGDVAHVFVAVLVASDEVFFGEAANAHVIDSQVQRAAEEPAAGVRGCAELDVIPAVADTQSSQQREVPGQDLTASQG
jgi:hypothetical protein